MQNRTLFPISDIAKIVNLLHTYQTFGWVSDIARTRVANVPQCDRKADICGEKHLQISAKIV
jgi:hypothetical protein